MRLCLKNKQKHLTKSQETFNMVPLGAGIPQSGRILSLAFSGGWFACSSHNALLKLHGFPVSMGQRSLCKVTVDSIFLSLDQIAFGDAQHVGSVSLSLDQTAWVMHNHAVLPLSFLNVTAQPWPLPGCNSRPGAVMASSSLTTKIPFTFPPMKDNGPHLPVQ